MGGYPSEEIDEPRAGIAAKLAHARLRLVASAEGAPCVGGRLQGLVTGMGKSHAGNQGLAKIRVRQFVGRGRRAAPLAETQMIVPSGRVLFCELFQNHQDMGTSLRFAIGKGARYFLANVVPADQPGKLFLEICFELQVVTVFQLFRESG